MLTHFSLFTGIGGLDLAAEWAGFKTVGQCEFAEYPIKVLEKNFPNVERWRDVRTVTIQSIRERNIGEITVLSGGFPCQPHSLAGKRLASGDERDLWGEFARVICEVRPKWVVGENVAGLLSSENGRFFGRILRDFSQMGFNVGWGMWGACQVGAIHRRERIFIIAHTNEDGQSMRENIFKGNGNLGKQFKPTNCIDGTQIEFNRTQPKTKRELLDMFELLQYDNGLSEELDIIGCYGNTVVPQQAYPIFKAIADIEGVIK